MEKKICENCKPIIKERINTILDEMLNTYEK